MTTALDNEFPWIATLKRGLYYDLGGPKPVVFENGEPRPVSQAQRDHLEEHSVEIRVAPGWNEEYDAPDDRLETMCHFEFTSNTGDSDENRDGPLRQSDQPRPRVRARPESRRSEIAGAWRPKY